MQKMIVTNVFESIYFQRNIHENYVSKNLRYEKDCSQFGNVKENVEDAYLKQK